MTAGWSQWLAGALVVLGLLFMTLGVAGLFRLPDVYGKLHAQSKAVALGVVSLLAAAAFMNGGETAARGALVGAFLLLTAPVAAHAIARSAWLTEEGLRGPAPTDESPPEEGADREGAQG
ncbi:MAG: monovalent cation/H(+) antiporter subunit G [Actinomycetota bacterium]|nr:monovalent cation/H(+) antiporter subunit G [Actinomycetota bacterium]